MREEAAAGIFSVSELNAYVHQRIEDDPFLWNLRIRGEVSGFKAYPSGWYFSLKDDGAMVSCVMFTRGRTVTSHQPKDGEQVIVHGRANFYEQRGSFQFVVDMIRPDGAGQLWQRFEQLKKRLAEEGLFDEARKRPLPVRPGKIAVVTSAQGAVWHDIHKICRERDPGVPLVLVPVSVQGAGAAREIAEGIVRAQRIPGVDLVIVGRGGGSMEDLWCFNEEIVARAIADCVLPVISAVGHETDVTIADFAADARASTPSNAAEMAVPDRAERARALRQLKQRLGRAVEYALQSHEFALAQLRQRFDACSPRERLKEMESALALAALRLESAADRVLEQALQRLARAQIRLKAIDPARVLERGYVLVEDGERTVTRAADAPARMTLRFADGRIRVHREE